jgi:hypothetical protein
MRAVHCPSGAAFSKGLSALALKPFAANVRIAMQQIEQHEKQRTVGRPFRKGRSGNTRGRPDVRRYREAYDALASEFGGDEKLSASQKVVIDSIAELKAQCGRRDEVRGNTIAKLVRLLNARPAAIPAGESLKDVLQELATDAADARSNGGGALGDARLLGAAIGDLSSWATWLCVLKASFGHPLDDRERALFDAVAGGRQPPRRKVKELIAVASRRSFGRR